MSRVLVLQHAEMETVGRIDDALAAAGVAVDTVRVDRGQPVPGAWGGAAGLIIMGGPQSVSEEERFPFLRDERRLIEQALAAETPVLGVCLGSQLLAAALGAEVARGKQREIGWYPVELTAAAAKDPLWRGQPWQFTAYHWHGDVFTLPRGAVALAASALTPLQAFRHGRSAYGLLFHLEVTEAIVGGMVTLFADELHQAGVDARAVLSGAKKHLPALASIGGAVFARWAKLVASSAPSA